VTAQTRATVYGALLLVLPLLIALIAAAERGAQ